MINKFVIILFLIVIFTSSSDSPLVLSEVEFIHEIQGKGKHHNIFIYNKSSDTIFYNRIHNCFTYEVELSDPSTAYIINFRSNNYRYILGERCVFRTDTGIVINLTAYKRIADMAINRKDNYKDIFSEIPAEDIKGYLFYMPRKIRRNIRRNKGNTWIQFDYWQNAGDSVKHETKVIKIE